MGMTLDQSPESISPQNAGPVMTPRERALLRLLVSGCALSEAASALGLAAGEAQTVLERLQLRAGATTPTRLLVLAVLNAWV